MAAKLKTNGKSWTVLEQIIEDPVSGLTFQFEVSPDGWLKLMLYGDSLHFGNRDLIFNPSGVFDGGGTHTGLCKPGWLIKIDGEGDDE